MLPKLWGFFGFNETESVVGEDIMVMRSKTTDINVWLKNYIMMMNFLYARKNILKAKKTQLLVRSDLPNTDIFMITKPCYAKAVTVTDTVLSTPHPFTFC